MCKTITQIISQKKNKNRCSIFLDEEYAFGLDQDVVFQYGLKKGDSLNQKQIIEIQYTDEKRKAKERALNFLSYRDRSEKEIFSKLKNLGYSEEIVDWVTTELKRLNLINDKRFALNFAQSKMISRPMGEFPLRRELQAKGITNEIIDETLDKIFENSDQFEVAKRIASKRMKQLKNVDEPKAKKRISDLLLRRGFNWDVISQILDEWDDLSD